MIIFAHEGFFLFLFFFPTHILSENSLAVWTVQKPSQRCFIVVPGSLWALHRKVLAWTNCLCGGRNLCFCEWDQKGREQPSPKEYGGLWHNSWSNRAEEPAKPQRICVQWDLDLLYALPEWIQLESAVTPGGLLSLLTGLQVTRVFKLWHCWILFSEQIDWYSAVRIFVFLFLVQTFFKVQDFFFKPLHQCFYLFFKQICFHWWLLPDASTEFFDDVMRNSSRTDDL